MKRDDVVTPWLTPEQAGGYLSRSKTTIYKLISERTIPSYAPDGKTLLRKEDLDAWVQGGKRG